MPARKNSDGQRYRRADGVHPVDQPAFQERDAGGKETADGGRETKRAGAAFGRILLRQPQRVHGEVRAAETEYGQTDQEPFERVAFQVIRVAEAQARSTTNIKKK